MSIKFRNFKSSSLIYLFYSFFRPKISLFGILLFFGLPSIITGQKQVLKSAEYFFDKQEYVTALNYFDTYDKIDKDKKALVQKGICEYQVGKFSECIASMKKAFDQKSTDNAMFLYTAMSYQALQNYKDAAIFYKNYLSNIKSNSSESDEVIKKIEQCQYAQNILFSDKVGFVENLGSNVNSKYNEINPVFSPTQVNKLYFSSDRNLSTGGLQKEKETGMDRYMYDVYSVENYQTELSILKKLPTRINTSRTEHIQSISKDGLVIFYDRELEDHSTAILTDTFSTNQDSMSLTYEFHSPIIYDLGDRDIFPINDSLYLFSSMREGGYGGYDIYSVERIEGTWGQPKNLGDRINTAFDDRFPFMTNGGHEIYYSSNSLNSLGGYDIFSSSFSIDGWAVPRNLALPVNTYGNEGGFRISADGTFAIFSSDRAEGSGGNDLYILYFKEQVLDQFEIPDFAWLNIEEETSEVGKSLPESSESVVAKKRQFFNKPLYYKTDIDVLGPQNLTKLKLVTDMLKIYPDHFVKLIGHATDAKKSDYDLYFSIKRTEEVAKYLSSHGLKSDKIQIEACGSSFPAVYSSKVESSDVADKLNNRIDMDIIVPENSPLQVQNETIEISPQIRNPKFDEYLHSEKGLSYRIYFASSEQLYKDEITKHPDGVCVLKPYDKTRYDYILGRYDTYKTAKKAYNKLSSTQYPNAKILVFIDGIEIKDEEVIKHVEKHTDLENYLLYEIGK